MPEINQLPTTSALQSDDLLPVYSSANGDARKASVNTLSQFVADQLNELTVTPSDATPQPPTTTGAAGVAIPYSRADHAHPSDAPLAANATPASPTPSGAVGTSARYARQDHSHPSDAPTASSATPAAPTVGGTAGVSTSFSRGDHAHPSDAPLPSDITPLGASGSGAAGSGATFSRYDHVHPGLTIKDEGVNLTTAPTSFDFTGAGVTATNVGGAVTVNIPGGAGSGTVTSVSVATANGFAGTVANPTTTPAITMTTSVTGILKGNGTAISAAVSGADYGAPITTKDEGVDLTTETTSINFTGAGVTATNTGGAVTVSIPGGGGFDPAVTNSFGGTSGNESVKILASGTTGTNFYQFQGKAASDPTMEVVGAGTNIAYDLRSKGSGGLDLRQAAAGTTYLFRVRGQAGVAANYLEVQAAAAGGTPYILATGSDANVALQLRSKGIGDVIIAPGGAATYTINGTTGALSVPGGGIRITGSNYNLRVREYATGSLPNASSEGSGTLVRDTTTATLKMSDGSVWNAVGGSGGGGWVHLATLVGNGTSGTFDFLNAFSSTYDNYAVVFQNMRPDAGSNSIAVRVAIGGVADASSFYAAGQPDGGSITATGNIMTLTPAQDTVTGWNGTLFITNVNGTISGKGMWWCGMGVQEGTSNYISRMRSGAVNTASVLTGIRVFTTLGANLNSQSRVRVYGIPNS